ncbi:MAG: cyclic nucleotide-binding domain-containing protein [Ignavibacteriales bacterium]|nr:cyclic nucleotide-binding domain-containing protein [Ignavibacteriales bacterium]
MAAMNPDKDIIIEILKNLNLFSELNYGAVKELAYLFAERVFQGGETIFEENDTGNSLLVILSGEVRITQRANVSGEETLTVLKKGDFFGEMALLEDLPRSATAIAHSDTFMHGDQPRTLPAFHGQGHGQRREDPVHPGQNPVGPAARGRRQDQGLRQPQPVDLGR